MYLIYTLAVLAVTVLAFFIAWKKSHTPMLVLSVLFGLSWFHYDMPGNLVKIGPIFSAVLIILLLLFSITVSNDKG